MPRYKLTVAYDGTHFHGWQKQHPPDEEPLRTVQGVLEQAVREVTREEDVTVIGASRTDSGVHARGQVAAFTTAREFDPARKLVRALTSRLPADVQVRRAEVVPEGFSPITDAVAKGYSYRLAYGVGRRRRPPLFDRFITATTGYMLDVPAMNEAARGFIGEHDFTSLTRLNHGRESTVRTVYECKVHALPRDRCRIEVAGNGFLYNMVRIIAGTLLEVGRGKLRPEQIPEIIGARDRDAAGPTMPPAGLMLMWIRYPDD